MSNLYIRTITGEEALIGVAARGIVERQGDVLQILIICAANCCPIYHTALCVAGRQRCRASVEVENTSSLYLQAQSSKLTLPYVGRDLVLGAITLIVCSHCAHKFRLYASQLRRAKI